jgi:HEAT repeat protein
MPRFWHRFGHPPEKIRRLVHFLFLAVSLVTVNVLAITLAESLFLSNAGPERLPFFYVLLAFVSIPMAAGFSYLVDRIPRLRLFRYLLFGGILLVALLRLLVVQDTIPVYYAIYIGVTLLELLIDIQFWVLVSDYFTSLDLKKYAPFLVMAMAFGGLLGGGLARLLSGMVATQNLLLLLPFLFAVAVFQLSFLEKAQKEAEADYVEEEAEGGGLLENLRIFPQIIRRYPIMVLIAGNGLLAVVVQRIIEFQVFTVYSEVFPTTNELTRFLGVLHAGLSVLEFGVTYFFTRPLIQRLGVSRMNLVYPVFTLASLAGLAASFRLPAAIGAHISYDTLAHSVAQPVETLNYNAVPDRFRSRVRVISDGFFYPGGLALAGGLLLVTQQFLTTLQVTLVGAALGVALLLVGSWLSKRYPESLIQILRSRSVNLDEVSEGLTSLPPHHAEHVRDLLLSDDPASQVLGLELATRVDPAQFLGEAQALLLGADPRTLRSLIKFYCAFRHEDIALHLQALLESENEIARQMALETLIARQEPLSDERLRVLLRDQNADIRALACVAARQADSADPDVQTVSQQLLQSNLESPTRLATARAIRNSGHDRLTPLLRDLLRGAEASVKKEALDALADMARPGDAVAEQAADGEVSHDKSRVRAAAYKIFGLVRNPARMPQVAAGLADPSKVVRETAAAALASYGEQCLSLAGTYLNSPRPEVVDAAISGIGQVGTRRAEDMLYEFMKSSYRQVADNLRWLVDLPPDDEHWQPLRTTLEDSNQRISGRVLHVLSSLGQARTLNHVKRILHSRDERMRADAIETLGALSRRRFVEPILPLLEFQPGKGASGETNSHGPLSHDFYLLHEALQASDRWIRIGALAVLAGSQAAVPLGALTEDPDPLVAMALLHTLVAKAYLNSTTDGGESGNQRPDELLAEEQAFMNRVLFLKKISLFQYLSLDQLLTIDEILDQKEFLSGETIFAQGSLGSNFYIIYRGTVVIRRKFEQEEQELAQLSAGEFFGEMSLFDDAPRSATAVAATDCTLLAVDRSHFHSLIDQRPEIALEMCRVLSLRLRMANERLGWYRWRVHWKE